MNTYLSQRLVCGMPSVHRSRGPNVGSTMPILFMAILGCVFSSTALAQAELWIKDDPNDNGPESSTSPTPFESPDIWITEWSYNVNTRAITSPGAPNYNPMPYPNPNPTPPAIDNMQDPVWVQQRQDQHPQFIPSGYNMPVWINVKVRNRGNAASTGTEVL